MTALAPPPVITRRRVAWALGAAALPWALPGCAPIARPVTARMDSLREPADPARRAETLLVLLPGAYDTTQDFVREGFVQAVRERGLPLDLLLPDAHIGYYNGRLIVERLLHEVVRPARAAGYVRVWLAGISLGGYGSLLFARDHGALLDGVFVMAAFLGRRDLPAAIAFVFGRDGGHRELHCFPARRSSELAPWSGAAGAPSPSHPPLWMGYGEDDRFVMSNRLVAAVLPPAQVFTTEGGHQWAPWRRLWARFLDRAPWAGAPR